MSTASRRRAYRGPALFSFGFRPFFLFGAAWGALVAPLWVWSMLTGGCLTLDWHIHEMLFGFLGAILAGFLTTAIPNWTGRMPVIGGPLGGLVALWCLGRVAMLLEPSFGPVSAVLDSLFLLVFAGVVWREVLAGRNWRNLPVCALVTVFALGNVAFHIDVARGHTGVGQRIAIAAIGVMIALIGGRITPSFTRNWMKARKLSPEPAVPSRFDTVAIGAAAVAGGAWIVWPDARLTGVALIAAGLVNLVRLSRWSGWRVSAEPIVWILHVGYAWLGVGLMLLGATRLTTAVPVPAGVHALTAGAVGVMVMAVITRASRGHTGRPLAADKNTLALYLAVNLAAVLRVSAPFAGALQPQLLMISAACWTAAFGGYAVSYGRMLVTRKPATA